MKGIYYIVNTIDEWRTSISGYFTTEDEAKDALNKCADWWRPKGTGEIWFQEFGVGAKKTMIFKNR